MNKVKFYSFVLLFVGFFISSCISNITLVENNKSNYKIIIPANATEIEQRSADELKKYLAEISNAEIEIVSDSEEESEFEISIGNTNRLNDLGVNVNNLEEDGYSIKTKNNKIFILGGNVKGTLYGVYTFLDNFLNVKMYAPGVYDVPKQSDVIIPKIDLTEIPIIKYRELHIPSARLSQEFCDWHKIHHPSVREREYGSFVHTFQHLIPPEKYFDKHPEYFSEINGIRIPDQQLCLSNPEVYDVVLENLKKQMEEKPEAIVWDVSQNDNFGNCMCESCAKADSIYQSPSGLMIEFVNKIAREFPENTISTLAYQYTRKAPVGIKPEPNVMVVLCTIECDRSKPIADNQNDLFNRDIKEWSALTDNIKIWDYVVQFSCYTNPFPNFHVLQPNIKLFVDHGVKSLFEQGSGNSWSDMHELKAYVLAKLMWNPNADVNKIINEFIYGYYGKAAQYIIQYFEIRQSAVQNSNDGLIIYGYPRTGINSYLTPALLMEYTQIFDKAEQSVIDDPKYLERVRAARIPLEYAILEIAKLNVNDDLRIFIPNENDFDVNKKMIERLDFFVSNANITGIERIHERGLSPDEYNSQMQKYFREGMIIHKGYKKNIEILSDIHPNYTANGASTLTDGITGEANYFFNWLGFEANEFEAIVDLNESMDISSIRTNFLQEVKSWIWLPKSVEYYISNNGINFTKIGEVKRRTKETQTGIFTESFSLSLKNKKARYVKVKTNSLINCPVWHIGHNHGNGKAFIFIDEIIVE
ncbi:MAG: DUF4838 domain-containing protein [Ignavibacteriales bacterium]|nr:DUF4838 domain-containing protein [Ignavibacteriales bacterium]